MWKSTDCLVVSVWSSANGLFGLPETVGTNLLAFCGRIPVLLALSRYSKCRQLMVFKHKSGHSSCPNEG